MRPGTSTLGEKQRRFAECVGLLLVYLHSLGYRCALAWAYRPPECAAHLAAAGKGIRNTLHEEKLAIDLDLFDVAGTYLTTVEAHRPLGRFWTDLDPDARWGGDWGDGNHYSFQHGGRR